ncbi:MAG TPA: tetratricopeptide repeat protein, partial [Thermoanaerobaculia bacterium]
EGRKAEAAGLTQRAARAFDAALKLDEDNADARAARAWFLFRRGDYMGALKEELRAAAALVSTREGRLAVLSSAALWFSGALLFAFAGLVIAMGLRRLPAAVHDLQEYAHRSRFGSAAVIPLALAAILAPLAVGFGPVWIALWWAVLVMPYAAGKERIALITGLVAIALCSPLLQYVARENILQRSPLHVAAVDLEERREDASAEDGLRQASSVFAEDSDVWFLLGMYAERSGDLEKAAANYTRAIVAEPTNFRNFLNRGNVRFREGDFTSAIRDYEAATNLAPQAAEAFFNLSLAKGEAYDFPGQASAMTKARALNNARVEEWSEAPALQRIVTAPYSVTQARDRIERWNAQEKSKRLPGHAPPLPIWRALLSPFTLLPLGFLALAVLWSRRRDTRGVAEECDRCGAAYCPYCKNRGEAPLYCNDCVRLHLRKESGGIEEHVRQNREMRRRLARRERLCRLGTMLFPGTHRVFQGRTIRAAIVLLLFAFFAAMAIIDFRVFDPRRLAPEPHGLAITILAAFLAVIVWIAANIAAWRQSHGA